jgi:ribosome small subunit-dependent GTPase A
LVDWKERLLSWGYKPLFCSVNKKDGLSAVEEKLKGKTTVVMGPSGVGKSSLINALRVNESGSDEDIMNKLFEQVFTLLPSTHFTLSHKAVYHSHLEILVRKSMSKSLVNS